MSTGRILSRSDWTREFMNANVKGPSPTVAMGQAVHDAIARFHLASIDMGESPAEFAVFYHERKAWPALIARPFIHDQYIVDDPVNDAPVTPSQQAAIRFWYGPAPKATGPGDLTNAKVSAHYWCGSCKLMGVSLGRNPCCEKCKEPADLIPALERTVP